MIHPFRDHRRRKLRAAPFPAAWSEILARNAPFVARLTSDELTKLQGDIQIFVAEKTFIGGSGLEITDEHRVTIAASAARLVRRLDISLFDRLSEIVVHPGAYIAPPVVHRFTRGIVGPQGRLGESQHWGVVVISWQHVLSGAAAPDDGDDVALHELAHVLDKSDGSVDGTPPLRAFEDYRGWAEVMTRHYHAVRDGTSELLRDYAGTNEAEFFAVATEVFFERPAAMREHAPDLYAALQRFYGDPK